MAAANRTSTGAERARDQSSSGSAGGTGSLDRLCVEALAGRRGLARAAADRCDPAASRMPLDHAREEVWPDDVGLRSSGRMALAGEIAFRVASSQCSWPAASDVVPGSRVVRGRRPCRRRRSDGKRVRLVTPPSAGAAFGRFHDATTPRRSRGHGRRQCHEAHKAHNASL